jgi:hypothetical protein
MQKHKWKNFRHNKFSVAFLGAKVKINELIRASMFPIIHSRQETVNYFSPRSEIERWSYT